MESWFDSREAASLAAAERIGAALTRRLDEQGAASLVVSGGTTPAACFRELANMPIGWKDVTIVLSDERWVAPDHDDSNEKFVRDTLLTGPAHEATLLPAFQAGVTLEYRCEQLNDELRRVPFPFACVLLGMGEDGHFASLFPDAGNLDDALAADSRLLCMPVVTSASPHPRLSLTLTALSRSDEIVLLMFGDAKRGVYEAAKASDDYPVSRLLRQKRAPLHVCWAP